MGVKGEEGCLFIAVLEGGGGLVTLAPSPTHTYIVFSRYYYKGTGVGTTTAGLGPPH